MNEDNANKIIETNEKTNKIIETNEITKTNEITEIDNTHTLDMPYEKFKKLGAKSLSDAELLAIVIRTGSKNENAVELGKRVLALSGKEQSILGLHHISLKQLMSIRGIGEVKAVKIKCIAEFSSRIAMASTFHHMQFTKPQTVAAHYMEALRHKETERAMLILLDGKNRLLEEIIISTGTVNASLLSTREIFKHAIKANAVYTLLLHNHPSGDPTPSREDILVTKKIKEAGQLMEIPLIDHIIIGDNKYISLKEKELL